jgi:Major Facilitator Superfamily
MGKTPAIHGGKRFYIAVFLFFNLLINYIDRVNLSVAAPSLVRDFHWDAARLGWVFSAHLWTYTILLIPTGALLDPIGARRVSAMGITVWSAAAMVTGAVTGFASMCAARPLCKRGQPAGQCGGPGRRRDPQLRENRAEEFLSTRSTLRDLRIRAGENIRGTPGAGRSVSSSLERGDP